MAEDLKIRVKVEPNTTGLQGKLDEAAKNYKLKVELFDKKGLESQILAIRKSIKDLVSQTSKDLTTMAVSMNTQSKTMATGISQLASSFGTVEAAQSKVIKNQEKINDSLTKKKPIKIYDKAEIRELEFAVSKMKELRKKLDDDGGVSDVNNTNRFKNELNKVIKSEGVGNATVDTKSLKNAVNSDLEILQKYIDDKDHLIEKSKNADGKITYNLNKEISNIIKDQSTSGASFISSLYNQLLQIDDAVDETDASFEQFGDGWEKIVSYLKSDSDDIDESFEAMASGASSYLTGILNIGDNLEEVYSKIQKFVDIGDTNGAIDYLKKYATLYREFIYESGITQEAQPTNIVFNDKFKKQLDKEINQTESELIKAKSQIDEKAKDVITSVTKASESIGKTASENVSSSFESFDIKGKSKNLLKLFDEIFSDINTKAKSNSQVIQDFKSKITAPLYEIERNVGEAFDSDYISNLDEGSKETASHMSNLAMASSEAHKELTKLFGEIGGGSASSTQFAEFVVQLQKIYEYMTNLSDESAKIGDFKIGTASIPEAVSDDVMTKNAAKLEEAVQRLITLQTNLTIEKQRTLSVEKEIVDATNSGTEKLKQALDNQRRVTESAKQAQGKTNIDKPDDKPAKDAEEHSGKAKDNLQAAADAVKQLKTKGLDTVLKTVQKFVDGVCSDQSKVSAVSDKISEFNTKMAGFESAVTSYCKAITELNTYFEQNAAILSALKGAYDIDSAKEKSKAKKETEQQTSAKITTLLNKVNTASEKVVTAVDDAGKALKDISAALTSAAESAGSINSDGQVVLGAIQKLDAIFDQYYKALNNAGVLNAVDKPTDEKKATTTKKRSTKKKDVQKADAKPTASIDTDKLNQAASDIRSVMAKFNRVAKTTDTFAENINKLLDAGTKISKVIKKFNGIDTAAVETVKSNVAAKAQTGDVISANNDNAAKVATAAKDIENAGSNIEKAASKINTAADKTNKAADKEVKKANPLTADNAQREYKSTSDKYSKAEEYYKKNVVGTKFEDADTIKYYEELVAAMSKATAAKAEFDKSGSADALVAYQIALRDATDAFKVFDTKLDLVRDHFSEVNTRLNNLGKSLNTRFISLKENYAIVENLQAKASAKGYENLASRVVSDQFSDAFKEANNAVEKFNKDQSFENADDARTKLTALSVAIQAYRKELTEAESISKKAFEALPTKIEQVKSRIASLVEQQKKTTKDSKSYNILQEQIDNLTSLLNVLQQIDTNGSYSQFTDMFRQFQGIGDKNSITIKSLTSLLSAFGIEARDATSQVRNLNTELRNTRNINSWEKSMQNTMYTAQRYFNNNSKISTNTEAYARFVDFFNTYDEKIKSKMFTQENSSQMSKDWSELKKYIQDAGLETDKLSVKLEKLFEVNIKSQLANQVINAFQQGLRQVYQNVVDIDSAMTELKKVTDETSGAYSKFLSEAGDRAKNLGVSISDVVNATADFARLGYNLEDATQISDSAVMFKQVGDGVQSMDDATSDIISAMKAFNIEADKSLTITDRYNEVGRTLPQIYYIG